MLGNNIPEVKLGIIAVSRDCFPIALSTQRRENIVKAYGEDIYNCTVTVENEADMLRAVADVKEAGCNALVVFLGNFGPETPETQIAQNFDGPCMFVAAAEGDGDMINGRGDAYCGMLNCSYNLGMRHLKGYIPEYPVGTAEEVAQMMKEFVPIARAIIGISSLKIITFGPRPQDFFACNAPIKGLYELGIEVVASENYAGSDTVDFASQLTNIAAKNPDVLLIPDYYNIIALVAEQAADAGLKTALLGVDGWDTVADYVTDLSLLDGAYYCAGYSTEDTSDAVQGFISNYEAKYGDTPNMFSAQAYDAAAIIVAAMTKVDTEAPELEVGSDEYRQAVVDAMKATDADFVTGHVTYDEYNNPQKTAAIIGFADGASSFWGNFGA